MPPTTGNQRFVMGANYTEGRGRNPKSRGRSRADALFRAQGGQFPGGGRTIPRQPADYSPGRGSGLAIRCPLTVSYSKVVVKVDFPAISTFAVVSIVTGSRTPLMRW